MFSGITLAVFITAIFILLFFSIRAAGTKEKPAAGRELVHHFELKWPKGRPERGIKTGVRGDPRTCPVCAAVFEHGERIKSKIFPQTGRNGRLLHISGCPYCVNGERRRLCPVCGAELSPEEYLSARVFPRAGKKSHVHVLGCKHCRF